MTRPNIKSLSAANVDTQSIDYDWSEGYPEKWEYTEAARCDKCNKVLIGRGGEEHHNEIDEDSKCDGYINIEGPMINYY